MMKLLLTLLALSLQSVAKEEIDFSDEFVETEDMPDDLDDEVDEEDGVYSTKVTDLPERLDLRTLGIMHEPINQGKCNNCGWVSGTQTLEARIALVSENYIPYSIQNFMNCKNKVCSGVQPYSVTTQAMKDGHIVPEVEIPFTRHECTILGDCDKKCGYTHVTKYTNALDDQFVVIAGTKAAHTEEALIEALQDGPVTTCFSTKSVEEGERCSKGCTHANSIIGYSKKNFLLQDSFGANWGGKWGIFQNGTWVTARGSVCANTIIGKAYFPHILYDYDRANAYFTKIEDGVREDYLRFVDMDKYGVTEENKKNWGTAKNKCAFIGSACKGVVALSSGKFELVSNFKEGSPGDLPAFMKTQMVVYLRNEDSGKYIGIKKKKKVLAFVAAKKSKAAPFFTSNGRFIPYDYPDYHMLENKMVKIVGGLSNVKVTESWTLNDCNLYNANSGNSFDVVKTGEQQHLTSGKFDVTSTTQRFDLGISGRWTLTSRALKMPLVRMEKNDDGIQFSSDPKASISYLRWNARQIIRHDGKVVDSNVEYSKTVFNFSNTKNWFIPTGCSISKLKASGGYDHLALVKGKVVMSSKMDSKWTFEYADLS